VTGVQLALDLDAPPAPPAGLRRGGNVALSRPVPYSPPVYRGQRVHLCDRRGRVRRVKTVRLAGGRYL
jgi:hypothetical protein